MIKSFFNKIIVFLLRNKFMVLSASRVQIRDVTNGLDKRTISKKNKVVSVRGRSHIYSQRLIVQRGDDIRDIEHSVKFKIKKTKIDGKVIKQVVLKPKRKGNIVRVYE